MIQFPDAERARGWYESDAYQEILPLRTDNSDSVAIVVERTPPGYRAEHFATLLVEQGVVSGSG